MDESMINFVKRENYMMKVIAGICGEIWFVFFYSL